LKRLVEEPGNYRFCEIEKTSFEVSKFLQRKTPVVNDGFVRNLLYSICVNNKMQLLSQNFQIWSKYRKIKYFFYHTCFFDLIRVIRPNSAATKNQVTLINTRTQYVNENQCNEKPGNSS